MPSSPDPLPPVSRHDLTGRLDDFLIARLDPGQDQFTQRAFVPRLCWNRMDLAIKLYYAQTLGPNQPEFVRRLYDAHIRAFSLGDMREPGNVRKSGIDAFHREFAHLVKSCKRDGFDPHISLIPLARDGSILNGAHRTACALMHGIRAVGVETGLEPVCYDHDYFRRRGMPDDLLDAAAVKYVEYSPRARIALIWPAAENKDAAVHDLLGPLVYRKPVRLTPNGAFNLLAQVYANEPWLGEPSEHYPGIKVKLFGCFSGSQPLRVLVFDTDKTVDQMAMKDRIRALFGIGKHSIHMTDSHAETLSLARLLLNDRSVEFLNNAAPMAFEQTITQVTGLYDYLHRNGCRPDDVIVDARLVLAAYGLRPAAYVDFLTNASLPPEAGYGPAVAQYYDAPVSELMADPAMHFHYWDLKFIAPAVVARMKRHRNTGDDARDLQLLAPLLKKCRNGRAVWLGLVYRGRMLRSRLRREAIGLLDRLGLKPALRRVYWNLRTGKFR